MLANNVIKSFVALAVLLALPIVSFLLCRYCFIKIRNGTIKASTLILTTFHIFITLIAICLFGDYVIANNVIKSFVVLAVLLALLFVSFLLCRYCIIKIRNGTIKASAVVLTTFHIFITLITVCLFGDYVYPFERTLEPIPHGVLVLPEDKVLNYPGEKFWHGAYEAFGLYAESFYFDTSGKVSKYGISWPPMDFENYSYIITYGQKIDKLTYNVWDTIDTPVRTGAKVGHMILKDEFSPELVYIYRIPKIRIENDVNNSTD